MTFCRIGIGSILLIAVALPLACTGAGSDLTTPSTSSGWLAPNPAAQSALAEPLSLSEGANEQFNCTHLAERFVRFSAPGFANGPHVGLYYNYVGAPPGTKTLEIFWDEEGEPGKAEYLRLGTGEVDRNDDSLFDVSGVAEHVYTNVAATVKKKVRANFIVDGLTGNCATVRRVLVSPEVSSSCVQTGFNSIPVGTPAGALGIPGISFSGPGDTTVQNATTVVPFDTLAGNFLIEEFTPGPLTITFDSPQRSYRFVFAIAGGPNVLDVEGRLGGATVFNDSFPSEVPPGFFNGEGSASGAGATFDSLVLTTTGSLIAIDRLSACP